MARFLAPAVSAAGAAVGAGLAKLPASKRAAAKEHEKVRRLSALARFLRLPRWYQDALRPNFRRRRSNIGLHGNRPTNPVVVARVIQRAKDKRARRAARNLRLFGLPAKAVAA